MTPPRFELPIRQRAWVDIAPLVDLVFLLLIFFLVGSRFVKPQIELTLPEAATGQTQSKMTAVLSVTADGRVLLNEKEIPTDSLEAELPRRIKALEITELTLRADRDTPFHLFMKLMDGARKAGIPEFHIEHEVSR
ncbi:ExbD/TolR family protein [Leptonema illini]|uniref:Outer membrane transport energization protein ExbD n=1 Tax=Leptonema illini DSM 21528 TaxID=929563 RepID=H2CJJ8_9LEPT|nr:biopolymer transporter ExbD [Leptonema illini]EHQ08159.1 outer membrane transport energization protein ExbD [Leptonema illini DSM 21528]